MNGIGGNSVAQVMESLSQAEVDLWQRYMRQHGSLSVAHQLEVIAARMMCFFAQTNGAKGVTPKDFMPDRLAGISGGGVDDDESFTKLIALGSK